MPLAQLQAQFPVTLASYPLTAIADPSSGDEADLSHDFWYEAQDSAKRLTRRDVVVDQVRFWRGSGFVRSYGPEDDGGLAYCKDGISWLRVGLMPSGKRTAKGADLGLSATSMDGVAVLDSVSFNGHRWCMTSGQVMVRFPSDDPSQTPVFDPALNSFGLATASFRSGYAAKSIFLFSILANAGTGLYDAAGVPTQCLFVVTYNSSLGFTRLYQYNSIAGWVESTTFTIRLDKATKYPVWWETRSTGTGVSRILAGQGRQIRQCLLGTNPLLEASWVTPIDLDPAGDVQRLLAFPQYAVGITPTGIWTFNDIRSMNLTPNAGIGASYSTLGFAALYNNGVVWARGSGLSFMDASEPFRRVDTLTEVGPMACMQDGTPIRGVITCDPVEYEGYLLMALYNHENQTAYVGRAIPRERIGVDVPNPWVHYWAEQVIVSSAGTGQQITHMAVSSPTVAGSTLVSARTVNLWMFTADQPFSAGSKNNLYSAPLPVGSGPLSYQASLGTFSYQSPSSFYFTEIDHGDPLATKYYRRFDTAGYMRSKVMALYTRANPDPSGIDNDGNWIGAGASTTADKQAWTPATPVNARHLGLKVVLTTDNASVGPIFQALSSRAKVVRETFQVRTLWVLMDQFHTTPSGALDPRDPDQLFDVIVALQDQGPVTFVDERGITHTVYVEQATRGVRENVSDGPTGYEWRNVVRLELSKVG